MALVFARHYRTPYSTCADECDEKTNTLTTSKRGNEKGHEEGSYGGAPYDGAACRRCRGTACRAPTTHPYVIGGSYYRKNKVPGFRSGASGKTAAGSEALARPGPQPNLLPSLATGSRHPARDWRDPAPGMAGNNPPRQELAGKSCSEGNPSRIKAIPDLHGR
uniref:Uncharacterized protein n=1 Tax=Candidatus Kentrum sp. DK TaxID=2126562 RepID=A0A450SPG5_9GAMM|nr:MAG: hypothetical protein BECKDK2373C_GA0170839_105015 [Candidatus Kentron sp. DK]VFJ70801.1 MAG: hypothetical protein BECKDK2373B_GA0170837_12981 [Candidatus Kentron sp. DK]